MSEKRVNIKITASTSDFDKAIKKAQKQIKELTDTIADINKDKFGDELEKQFKNITESAEKAQEQLKDIKDSLDDIDKIKLNKLEKQIEEITDSTEKLNDNLKDTKDAVEDLNKANTDKLEDGFKDVNKAVEDTTNEVKDLNKEISDVDNTKVEKLTDSFKDMDTHIDNATDSMKKLNNETDDFGDNANINKFGDNIKDIKQDTDNLADSFDNINDNLSNVDASGLKKISNITDNIKDVFSGNNTLNFDTGNSNSVFSTITEGFISGKIAGQAMENTFNDVASSIDTMANSFKDVATQMDNMFSEAKSGINNFSELHNNANEAMKEYKKDFHELMNLRDYKKELEKALDDLDPYEDYEQIEDIEHDIREIEEEIQNLKEAMNEYSDSIDKYANARDDIDSVMSAQVESYERLRKKVIEFIETHEKAIMNNKDVADSFTRLYNSMKEIYSDIEPLPDNMFDKVTKDAENLKESLSLISTETLLKDLNRLSKSIQDTTEKMTKLDQTFKEGFKANEDAQKLINDINELKKYTDYIEISVRKVGDTFEYFGDRVKEANEELDTSRIEEYMDALNEFAILIRDSGGRVSEAFANAEGQLDPAKYFRYFEEKGKPLQQINMILEKNRVKILENLKAEKKHAETMVETAKAARDQAKAQLEVAEAAERTAKNDEESARASQEVAEAKEKLAKAEKDLAEAQEKSKHIDKERIENAKKLVKQFNEQAEAARKLGSAIKDITQADISGFDKSLGTLMDDVFPDDLPKTLGSFKEDLLAVFESFNSFNLGDMADGLKDVFAGIFSAIPPEAKLVVAAITAVIVALDKLYESGKRQFFEGLEKGWSFITKIGDIARDVGQEVKDAFEDITGTQLDWSSLMALGPEFEYQMEKVGAIAGSNEQQLERLIEKAKELGGTTQYKASEVGEAFEYMAMAGYDTNEMLSSINGTLALSIASGTDLASTTDIVTDYMTALGLEANSTNDFVDKLAATITSSNTTVEKWGQSMKQVASQAGSLGITMTDLSTAIGVMANAGIKGSKAGTALKNVLANMSAPTKKQAAALKKLGFEADKETGSYLILDDDGNVDLEANIKKLINATKDLDKAERSALLTAIAGKEALPGLMAIIAQGAEEWDELSDTIENSTGKVQFWNECMSLAGKSGKDAVAAIDNMKEVFAKVESEGLDAGLSVEELSHAIAILGDDGKVAENDVKGLINVIDSMNTATDEAEGKWRALDKAGDDLINTSYDYDATVAKLMADTSGLSQKTKEAIKDKLKEAKTYEEANKILKEYNLTAERSSFANETYANKLQYLRDNLKGLSDEQIKTELTNLGLADSFDEVLEVVRMSDEEFAKYKENLESVKGMAESLSEAMDETTRAGLLELASAIENVAIAVFDRFEPAINEAVEALNEFFTTWHNGESNNFTFEGFETALTDITTKIQESQPQIQAAVEGVFDTIHRLVHGGSLDSLLDIGTSVITGICDGILNSEEELAESIDSFIKKICAWIQENGPRIEEAGKMLLDAITEGIENNEGIISDAMNTICDIITTWTNSSGELKAAAGLFAEQFVALALESMWIGVKNWLKEKLTAFAELFTGPFDIFGTGGAVGLGMNLWSNIMEGLFGSDPIGEAMEWLTDKLGSFNLLEFIFDLICKPFSGVFKAAELFGDWNPIEDIKGWFNDKVGDWSFIQWAKDKLTGKDDSKDSKKSNKKSTKKLDQVDVETLVNIDEKELSEVEDALVKLQTAAQKAAGVIRTEFVNMTNIARNQMLNISNIIRNQAINWANIIRNQAKNARDGFTQQMLSMASVARTQLVNISNIIRNQSLSWYNVINNQAKNARDAFTRQMMSMVKVARNQMYNVLSTVRSYMSQITGATNKSISLNVGQSGGSATLPTTPALAMADALYAANAASTYSLDASGISSRASSASSNNSSASYGPSEANIIHTHVYLEGREIAKASAKYMNDAIKAINKRENRKRGVK